MQISLILHNIRSTHNVGSIFRTADGAGVERIFLSGYTPHPIDQFGRERKDIAKVALGAEKTIPWSAEKNTLRLMTKLQKEGWTIIALEQNTKSVDYRKFRPNKTAQIALILGEEVKGIEQNILTKVDAIIEIPMRGGKESLNVSVATGIALYEITRNRRG